jgi:hypothetical protein
MAEPVRDMARVDALGVQVRSMQMPQVMES